MRYLPSKSLQWTVRPSLAVRVNGPPIAAPARGGCSPEVEELPDDGEQAMSSKGTRDATNFRYMTAGFMLC